MKRCSSSWFSGRRITHISEKMSCPHSGILRLFCRPYFSWSCLHVGSIDHPYLAGGCPNCKSMVATSHCFGNLCCMLTTLSAKATGSLSFAHNVLFNWLCSSHLTLQLLGARGVSDDLGHRGRGPQWPVIPPPSHCPPCPETVSADHNSALDTAHNA